MDIYGLKADAQGAHHDAHDLANQEKTGSRKRRAYLAQARAYHRLYELCCSWVGRETPEEYLKNELLELPTRESSAVYKAIEELGYAE